MTDPCIKENELGKIEEAIDLMTKEIFGYGQRGLIKTVPRLEDKIDDLTKIQSGILTNVSALVRFQIEVTSMDKIKKEEDTKRDVERKDEDEIKRQEKAHSLQKIAIIVSSILSLGAIITAIIFQIG